jgi:broad specificity phosphatase PhoE
MRTILTFVCLLFLLVSCSRNTYYIVRHAEKATAAPNMSSDVLLNEAGQQRAVALKIVLANKKVQYIFSTQTIRTSSTAKPLSEWKNVPIQFYTHRDTLDKFISRVKAIKKGDVLIVGHSNTVDDLVNKMMGQTLLTDLPETEYDHLFIVKRKGKTYLFERRKY